MILLFLNLISLNNVIFGYWQFLKTLIFKTLYYINDVQFLKTFAQVYAMQEVFLPVRLFVLSL